MMTSYSEEETTPKTLKVKFVKISTSSNPTMLPRPQQVKKATPPQVPTKGKRMLPPRSQGQSDLTSEGVESQVYSSPDHKIKGQSINIC